MLPFLHRLRGLRRSAGGARQYLAMGAHGKLYFNIGSPQNLTMPTYLAAVTRRIDPNTGVPENSAQCVRNSVGMAFHLKPRQPRITKHARDWTSDDMPSDDVDVVSRQGGHFGFPFWWPGDFPDPQYGKNRSCTDFTKLKRNLGAQVASPGMRLHTDKMFPASFTNNIFIARNGSRSHTVKQGYNLARVTVDGKGNAKSESFPEGLMIDEKANPPTCCRWPMVLCWCRATITASSTA